MPMCNNEHASQTYYRLMKKNPTVLGTGKLQGSEGGGIFKRKFTER